MRRVYKFQVRLTGLRTESAVAIPNCRKVVLFGPQGSEGLFVWAEVADTLSVDRQFLILGTGDDVPDSCAHVASCQDGPYVWHLYERAPS